MRRDLRALCEELSIKLYNNKNAYRRIERGGVPLPTVEVHEVHGGQCKDADGKTLTAQKLVMRRVRLTDEGIVELLQQEFIKREQAELAKEVELLQQELIKREQAKLAKESENEDESST